MGHGKLRQHIKRIVIGGEVERGVIKFANPTRDDNKMFNKKVQSADAQLRKR
jgi:hypothetical protein